MTSTPSNISELLEPVYQAYGEENVYVDRDRHGTLFQVFDTDHSDDGHIYGIVTDETSQLERKLFDIFNHELRDDFTFFSVVTPSFSVVFQPVSIEDVTYLKTLPDFPVDGNEGDGRAKISNAAEAKFLFDISTLGFDFDRGDVLSRLVNILRKLEAERLNLDLPISEELPSVLENLDEEILSELPYLDVESAPPNANSTIACISAFAGYRLHETPVRIRQALAEHIIESGDDLGTFATSPSLASFLVEIADVRRDDRVLDPACGVGKIVRSASVQCDESVGIEKHSSVATKAVAINHLVGVDADIRSADALSAIENGEAEAHSFDHIITVPPFGMRLSQKYEASDGFTASVVEEAISRESFEYLKPGGKFTALLPTGVFYRRSAEDLRHFLFEKNTVTRIIEVGSGLLAPYSSVPVVILQAQSEQPSERYPIESAVVEAESISSEDIKTTLQEDTRTIFSDDFEDSYLPSEVFKSNEAISNLEQSFDSLIQLDSIAEVRSGEKVEERQLAFEEGVPFLKIGDVEKDSPTEKKGVPKAEVSDRKTTSDGDILISTHGTVGKVVVPAEPVIPSSNWAVARFEHPDVALVYAAFLSTPQGREQIQAQAVGSIINYVPLSKLRSILIPDLSHSEISRCADEIRALDIDWDSPVAEDSIQYIQDIFAQYGGDQ
jgi:hypothetical protein